MKIIKTLIYLLVIGLVLVEGYLIASMALGKSNQEKDVQTFCSQKCNYNPSSSFWEFSGDYSTKGFTTKEECYIFCSKVRLGFASVLQSYGAVFLSKIGDIFKK